jgi:GT2 family glycosyltransferase
MRCFAVIATYNRPDIARRAVEALQQQTRPPDRIVIVENSDAPTLVDEYAAAEGIDVVVPGRNTGAAGGFALGAEYAVERGCSHVLLVDDDCIFDGNALEQLETNMARVPGAVVAPVITSDGEELVWQVYRPDGKPYRGRSDLPAHPIPTRHLAFHGILVSADAIRDAGPPREDLFFGGPDVEFSLRLAAHGYAIFYCPDAHARHHAVNYHHFWLFGQRKVPRGTPGHRYYVLRNRLLMWRMYHRDSFTVGVMTTIAREALCVVRSTEKTRRIRLLLAALRDGLVGDPRRRLRNEVPLHD